VVELGHPHQEVPHAVSRRHDDPGIQLPDRVGLDGGHSLGQRGQLGTLGLAVGQAIELRPVGCLVKLALNGAPVIKSVMTRA
jgi:hypothetical protein